MRSLAPIIAALALIAGVTPAQDPSRPDTAEGLRQLEASRADLLLRLEEIDEQIDRLRASLANESLGDVIPLRIVVKTRGRQTLFSKPNAISARLRELSPETEVEVVGVPKESMAPEWVQVRVEGLDGYLLAAPITSFFTGAEQDLSALANAVEGLRASRVREEEEAREHARAELRVREAERRAALAEQRQLQEQERATRLRAKYPKEIAELVIGRKVRIGMTAEQARDGWGEPDDINRTITRGKTTEQWIYGSGSYLYFEDGILVAIQN